MYLYDAHFAVKCYKTGHNCLDGHLKMYTLKLAPAQRLLVSDGGFNGTSFDTIVTCKVVHVKGNASRVKKRRFRSKYASKELQRRALGYKQCAL